MLAALDRELNKLMKRDGTNYICLKCGKTSIHKNNLKNHIEAKHLITEGFNCQFCNGWFKTQDSFRKHIRRHEKNDPVYLSQALPMNIK